VAAQAGVGYPLIRAEASRVTVSVAAPNSDEYFSLLLRLRGTEDAICCLFGFFARPIKQFPYQPPGVVKKTVSYPALTTTDWYLAS
jgi:hypothetical protein